MHKQQHESGVGMGRELSSHAITGNWTPLLCVSPGLSGFFTARTNQFSSQATRREISIGPSGWMEVQNAAKYTTIYQLQQSNGENSSGKEGNGGKGREWSAKLIAKLAKSTLNTFCGNVFDFN